MVKNDKARMVLSDGRSMVKAAARAVARAVARGAHRSLKIVLQRFA